jgi:hypothetical protein
MPMDKEPSCSKIRQNPPKSAGCGISGKVPWHSDRRGMPTVAPTIEQITTVGEIDAES